MRRIPFSVAALVLLIPTTASAAPPELLGKWETVDPDSQNKIVLEFGDKSTLKISVGSVAIEAKYKFVDDENLEMTLASNEITQTEKVKVKLANGELVLTGKDSKPMTFKRVTK